MPATPLRQPREIRNARPCANGRSVAKSRGWKVADGGGTHLPSPRCAPSSSATARGSPKQHGARVEGVGRRCAAAINALLPIWSAILAHLPSTTPHRPRQPLPTYKNNRFGWCKVILHCDGNANSELGVDMLVCIGGLYWGIKFICILPVLMEPVVLNRERAATDRLKRMPMLFDDYRDEDFYGLPRKYSIVARVEVKFPIEPRFRDRQHFVLSDINGAKIEAITYMYETVKHFDNLLHEKHVYKMHNVKFSLHPGEFNFRHLNGSMELYLDQQTIVEPYTVPIQMAPFPKQILLNLADVAELPNRTLVDIMAIVVHFDTIHRTMWGPFRKIVIMDARGYLHIIKVWGDLLNKNALRWVLAKEDYGIIIGTMFRRFRRQECLESSDHTAIHFNLFHHNTHHFGPIQKALVARNNRQFVVTFLEEQRRR
ncbi:hypothetical protein ZEAMMB73_Zm00001d048034 [Zea mays]|uniref:ATP-dependent DNA helicase n=2 Tax=Zea mays TaxID=4577 RepID=A0A1D6PG34_MAIZE|nr:hypothetical protein ZEAMMB73_Zm00001d048034 [Zea mays]